MQRNSQLLLNWKDQVEEMHSLARQRQGKGKDKGKDDGKDNDKDKNNVSMKVVEHDEPAEAALAEAANGYDLVIVGVGQEWGLEERRFGVHPERIISECPTSLLVVKTREV